MPTLKDAVRNALIRIQKNGQVATPDVYQEAFCEEAKKLGLNIDAYQWKTKWLKQLDSKTRNQIRGLPLKTQEDFVHFLATTITRLQGNDTKELFLLYKELFSMFLYYYASHNPSTNPNLIKDSRELIDGNSQINGQIIKERWSVLLKQNLPKESKDAPPKPQPAHEAPKAKDAKDDTEREENLDFFSPLLRPSLTQQAAKQPAIDAAAAMLKLDLALIVKDKLVNALENALKERIQIDKNLLLATVKKHSKELENHLEVIVAKIASLQIAGEMMFNEIAESNKQLKNLTPQENNLLSFKDDMLSLLSSSETRFQHIQEAMSQTKSGLDEVAQKIGGENKREAPPPKESLDKLTGVYTLAAFKQEVAHHEEMFARYNQSYSVFYIDIDNFQHINDSYSNESGDKILATFGKLLKNIVRKNDYVIRVDGEEFLIFLAGMDHFDSSYFAEKIRTQIAESTFVYGQYKMQISVTIGVADRNETSNFDNVVARAKARMLQAKKLGYNRIATED
ncbi:MAG: diguanylate cyclase [Helicobacter sp.]|nr:diguanylate cyclase [Helicobacter sp.]MDE5816823.1 GGDEF domain-containing protein [Helicobacter sp.]